MSVKLRILQIGPSSSVQDAGRRGHLRYGVTESGVMDRVAYHMVNAALGNPSDAPVLEISLGGAQIVCEEGSLSCAVGGGDFNVSLDGNDIPSWSIFTLTAGSTLRIRSGSWGSWCYIAFAASLQSERWLGSASVTMGSGLCGAALAQDDLLELQQARLIADDCISYFDASPLKPADNFRVVLGPQDRFFDDASKAALTEQAFEITAEYNRMGMRLKGPSLNINQALDMPSEPIARGSLQVPGHGDPICLMADHQTAGGYPKIATVISTDLDRLAQCRAGDVLRFSAVSVAESIQLTRAHHEQFLLHLEQIAQNRLGLTERLWSNNLISGSVDAEQF